MAKCVVNRKDNGDISVLVENLRHPESIARHRNGGYDFDKAPNGSNSELYDSLTKELGLSDVEARSVIIDIYSDGFGDTHGVWWNDPSVLRLDSNGQPKLYYDKGNLAGKKFLSTEFGGNSAGFLKVSDTDTKVFEPLSISVLSESDSDSITLLNGGQEEVLLKNSYDFINIRSTESLSKGNLLPDLKLIGNILVEKGLVSSVNFGTSDEIKQEIQKINDRNRLKRIDGRVLQGFSGETSGNQGLRSSGELGENNSGTEQGNEGGRIRINYHLVPIREVSEAENLEKEGLSDLDIKKKTGLEKGSDGVWRLELDKGELNISEKGTIESDDLVGNVVSYRLGDIYDQEDLFYLIQGLDDIKVYTYEESKGNELSSREGFAKGNSIYIKRRDIQRGDFTSRKEKEDFEKVLVHEIQHLIQRVTNTPYGTSFVIESDKVLNSLNGLKENRDFVSKEYSNRLIDNISNRTGLRSDEVLNRIDDVLKDGDLMYDISFDMYEQAHGEVEARNASNRISIPIEDRFQTLYKDSQDIKNPLLKYHLVPVSDSSKAEELEKQGLSELGIKRQTGIERGRDGIWRKEIPTKDIDLSESKFKRVWHGDFDILEEADLTDIYNNEDLYKEFPQLKNTVVYLYDGFKHDPEDSNEGFQYGGHIFINKRRNREDKSRRKHILFHEIQHLIQRASGTSGGTNFDRMLGEIESRYSGLDKDTGGDTLFTRVLDEHVKDVTKSKYDSFSKLPSSEFNRIKRALAQRMYDSKYGEIEAETAARRGLYPNQDLRNVTLFKDADRYIEQGVWYSDSDLKYHLVPVEDSSSAEELEKQGLNELDIKNRTGLERGRDGIWRKEIGVGKFDFNAEGTLAEMPDFIGKVKVYKLGDIYGNKELYSEYPFLEKAEVVSYEKSTNKILNKLDGFQYEGRIYINNSESRETTPEDVILHEIQHIIQRASGTTAGTVFEEERDRVFEEFERGYNEVGVDKEYSRVFRNQLLDIFKGNETSVKFLFTEEGKTYRVYVADDLANRMYKSKYGEVEARNASHRSREMSDIDRRKSLYKDTETSVENGVWFSEDPLLAPNGKPSNLTPEQWRQVRTQEFKRWFGDWENDPENASKVVDENGEPLVVYHGTNASEEFNIFKHRGSVSQGSYLKGDKVGFFFSNKKEIADLYSSGKVETKGFFINSRNAYFVDVEGEIGELLWNYSEEALEELGVDLNRWKGKSNESLEANDSATAYFDDHADELYERSFEEEGSDGLFVIGIDGSNTIIVRNPNQIKSATDNVGTFDNNNDDIRYSSDSRINGFYDPMTRQIWVNKNNPEKLLGTTFHELSHPYLDYLEITNPELFNAGIKLLEGKKSEAKYYFDRVDRNYPGLSESEYYKEVLAEMIADEGRNIADRKLKKDFLNWLSEFFQELGKVLGFSRLTPRKVANMSLNEMTQSMLSDMFDSSNQGLRLGQRYGIGTSYDTEVLARFRFDLPNLKKISQGSDRVVYDLGNGMVLKVAKTARGFAQNSVERDWYLSDNGLLPELYETGLNYNVMRKVEPLKKTDMVQTYDVDGNELGKVKVSEMFKDFATITQVDVDSYDESYQDVLYKYGLIDYMNYNMMWGDVKRIKNWGRDGENVVHIDGGTFNSDILKESRIQLEEEDFRQAYEESKRLKKLFKDSDKNTKFSIDNYNNRQIEFAIERNNGNELNLAPNGNPSNAYAQLKDSGLSDHKVYEILSEMYTDSFIENFGDWINGESTNLLLDDNGQPMVIWKGINSGDTKVDHKLGNNHFGNENFRTAMNYAYGFDTSSPSMRRRLNKFINTSDTVVKPVLVYGNGIAELDLNDGFGADQVMRENPEVDVVVGSSQNQSGNAYAVRDTEQFVDLSDNLLADIIGLDSDSEGVKFSLDSEESTSIVSDNSGTIDNELDRYVQSPVYEELKSIPGITPEQALDIYKHIYSTELIDWKDMDRTC